LYWRELGWAVHAFLKYITGDIGSPKERRLYVRARKFVDKEINIHDAKRLLDESIAIDPNSDAVYWLGENYFAAEQYD
jgi:hypothetical protein